MKIRAALALGTTALLAPFSAISIVMGVVVALSLYLVGVHP